MSATWQTLKQDSCWRFFAPAFVVLQLPYVLPLLGPKAHFAFSDLYSSPLQLSLVMVVLIGTCRRRPNVALHRIWQYLTAAFSIWWLNSLIFAFMPGRWWTLTVELTTDVLYALYYWCWLMAIAVAPNRTVDRNSGLLQFLRGTGAAVLTVGLLVYFVAIPVKLQPDLYLSWSPSFNLYVALDVGLTSALLRRAWTVSESRRRRTYLLLALTTLLFGIVDLLESLVYRGALTLHPGAATDMLWNLPFIPLVIAACLARQDRADPEIPPPEPETVPAALIDHRPSPLLLSSLVFPLVHIVGYQTHILDSSATILAMREQWVLICLLLLGVLASIENAGLRRAARDADRSLKEERDLRLAKAVAERSGRAKSHFLANISHEIRSPMSAILGLSDLLMATRMPAASRRYAELLQISAKGLLQTVDDLLEYAHIDAGELRLVPTTFSPQAVGEQLIADFKPNAEERGLAIDLVLHRDVPEQLVGDERRVRQVLRKLLSNAVKFTDQGHITVKISPIQAPMTEHPESSNVWLRLAVEDTGIGIDPDKQELLFQPFAQEDASSSRRFGGTGLGLAISRRLIEAMEGHIGVHSRPGHGSEFWLELGFSLPTELEASS